MPTYELVDGEEMVKKFPTVFLFPEREARMNVPDNAWVCLGFRPTKEDQLKNGAVDSENLWVQVDNRESETGPYYGTLGGHPSYCSGIKMGDPIQFEAKNILDIAEPD